MKRLLLILTLLPGIQLTYAQADSSIDNMPKLINNNYAQNIYNPETKTVNLSYNYSNLWDFDGDNKNDSLYFIGNGGAHAYFYLRIILSSENVVRDYTSVLLDIPYFANKKTLEKHSKNPAIQLIVDDFDNNGISDIYLNFDNPFGSIPKKWKAIGIHTKYVLLSFAGGKQKVKDY